MKKIIAELDRITRYLEEVEEPWTFNLVWRLDRVAQQLEEISSPKSKVSKKVLNDYIEKISLNENSSQLKELIKSYRSKSAMQIYSVLKKNFGSLNRKEAIKFIRNILEESKKIP